MKHRHLGIGLALALSTGGLLTPFMAAWAGDGAPSAATSSPQSLEAPAVDDAYAFYPQIKYGLRSGPNNSAPYQTALKDGDQTYLMLIVTSETPIETVTADLGMLHEGAPPAFTMTNYEPRLHQQAFQSDLFTVDTHGANGEIPITYSITDENGHETGHAISVRVDNIPPTLSIALSRTSLEPLTQLAPVRVSGTLDGTGTDGLFSSEYRIYGLDIAGHPIPGMYIGLDGGMQLNFSEVTGGAFSGEFGIRTPGDVADFPPEIEALQLVETVYDRAGNESVATSTPLAIREPDASTTPSGISNVLFLPGIEGSRLYDAQEKLWEPSIIGGNDDIRDLSLDANGVSMRTDIHTKVGDVIDSVAGTDIYDSFIQSMDAQVAEGAMHAWRAVPYDWRLSLDDIVSNGTVTGDDISYLDATTSPYLEQTLRELASSSPTGKVTIIAHSNGGLVAKALMQKLGDAETARLIDKVILVAVPQSGAPESLAQLLLGYDAGIPKFVHFIVSPATVRTFAENAPMPYHLLPSARYFSDLLDQSHPVVSFTGNDIYGKEIAAYGHVINTAEELYGYVLADEGGRAVPEPQDLMSPSVGNPLLAEYAQSVHNLVDAWAPPDGVMVYQIAGWGSETISGIKFYEDIGLQGLPLGGKSKYRPDFIEDGDHVVPVPSALMMPESENVRSYFVNLGAYVFNTHESRDHGSILSIKDLQTMIWHILSGSPELESVYISSESPPPVTLSKKLHFYVHSPVSLELFDQAGNRTGLSADGSIATRIPDSAYGQFGEVKYISVPAGTPYTLKLTGEDSGTFTLDIEEQEGNLVTGLATVAEVPTAPHALATLSITYGIEDASPLIADSDGDGAIDLVLKPESGSIVTPPSESERPSSHRKRSYNSEGEGDDAPAETVLTLSLAEEHSLQELIPNDQESKASMQQHSSVASTIPKAEASGEVLTLNHATESQQSRSVNPGYRLYSLFRSFLAYLWTLITSFSL